MPVLLLCGGDAPAKDLFRKAIENRYGMNPPAIENIEMTFEGRAKAKVGFLSTWFAIEAIAKYRFPHHMRWDVTVKLFGIPIQRVTETFDHQAYRVKRNQEITIQDSPMYVDGVRRRAWLIAAVLLTPLSETYVKLNIRDAQSFDAVNTQTGDVVTLKLNANKALEVVEARAMNVETGREQMLGVRISAEKSQMNGFIHPNMLSVMWDGQVAYELKLKAIKLNPEYDMALFTAP